MRRQAYEHRSTAVWSSLAEPTNGFKFGKNRWLRKTCALVINEHNVISRWQRQPVPSTRASVLAAQSSAQESPHLGGNLLPEGSVRGPRHVSSYAAGSRSTRGAARSCRGQRRCVMSSRRWGESLSRALAQRLRVVTISIRGPLFTILIHWSISVRGFCCVLY